MAENATRTARNSASLGSVQSAKVETIYISVPAYVLQMKMLKCNNERTTIQRACLVHLRACNPSYCAERTEWRTRVALPGQPWLSVKVSSMWNKCSRILSFPVSSHLCTARSRHRVHSSGGRRRRTTGTRHIWVIVMLLFPLRRLKRSSLVPEEGRCGA